jgi:transcriptional regulator with XRE-family HTH domain
MRCEGVTPVPVFHYAVLRQWRAESGMTAEEIAYRARCSLSYLRRLEAAGGNPSAGMLCRLAAVYGRDVGELFTASPDPAGAR